MLVVGVVPDALLVRWGRRFYSDPLQLNLPPIAPLLQLPLAPLRNLEHIAQLIKIPDLVPLDMHRENIRLLVDHLEQRLQVLLVEPAVLDLEVDELVHEGELLEEHGHDLVVHAEAHFVPREIEVLDHRDVVLVEGRPEDLGLVHVEVVVGDVQAEERVVLFEEVGQAVEALVVYFNVLQTEVLEPAIHMHKRMHEALYRHRVRRRRIVDLELFQRIVVIFEKAVPERVDELFSELVPFVVDDLGPLAVQALQNLGNPDIVHHIGP